MTHEATRSPDRNQERPRRRQPAVRLQMMRLQLMFETGPSLTGVILDHAQLDSEAALPAARPELQERAWLRR